MKHNKFGKFLTIILTVAMVLSFMPVIATTTAYAAHQGNTWRDPAENWITAAGRTRELDLNANLTYETQYCHNCNDNMLFLVFRVPEFTRSGETALNRGVLFSDGTLINGGGWGNLDDGLPGVNAFYTGYHWTKSICRSCDTLNGNVDPNSHAFGRDVYSLYDCAASFINHFSENSIERLNDNFHLLVRTDISYCRFCHGTHRNTTTTQRAHRFTQNVDPQIGHQRFVVQNDCGDCEFATNRIVTAKSVVASHRGYADGRAHTIRVTDLSDNGVITSIRFGTSANNINLTSAPNFVAPGFYNVYYSISYNYGGRNMTQTGVSYVMLLTPFNTGGGGGNPIDGHRCDFRYLSIVPPTCTSLGWENWQCRICGALERRNFVSALGHNHRSIVIREATCTRSGLTMHSCTRCGDFFEEITPMIPHNFVPRVVPPTCHTFGYTEHRCSMCDHYFITNVTPFAPHQWRSTVTPPTCTERGFTTHICDLCGDRMIDTFTDPRGHRWNDGEMLTTVTCEGDGVKVFTCLDCGETKLQAVSAIGHNPGAPATCTEPQRCLDCNAILELPTGHEYETTIIPPTCTTMGYTIFECIHCGDRFRDNFTDPLGHDFSTEIIAPTCTEFGYTIFTCVRCGETFNGDFVAALGHTPSDWIIVYAPTFEADGLKHIICLVCGEVLQTMVLRRLSDEYYTDNNGEARVGRFIVIVTDSNAAPIPHARVTIDAEDNIGVGLPHRRLLDYADQTTVTVLYAEDYYGLVDNLSRSVPDLNVTVSDRNDNFAMGITDEAGQIIVPTYSTSTGNNGGGTVGGEDEDGNRRTFTVVVTDRNGNVIDNCEISIDDDLTITVELPDGTPFNRDNPVTVTVTDQHGDPQAGLDIIVVGDDLTDTGVTNSAGWVRLPPTDRGYTNDNGKVQVNGYIVIVEDTENPIARAFVTNIEDGQITVLLPDSHTLTAENQITVTVLLAEDESPVVDMRVTVFDRQNRNATDLTNIRGQIVVPPTDRGYTNGDGYVRVNGFIVRVENETAPIRGAFVVNENNRITVLLPGTHRLNADNQTTVTVLLAADETPVRNMSVTVSDAANATATRSTNAEGQITVPDRTTTGGGGGGGTGGGGSGGGGGSWGGGGGGGITPRPPATITHNAYVLGFPNGTFQPDGNMTRAEASAIFARLLSDRNNERISGSARFPDVATGEWYAGYIGYLRSFGIIIGFPDGYFRPNNTITRAEFVTMSVRFYAAYNRAAANTTSRNNPFSDVNVGFWAMSDIYTAVANGWIIGYADVLA